MVCAANQNLGMDLSIDKLQNVLSPFGQNPELDLIIQKFRDILDDTWKFGVSHENDAIMGIISTLCDTLRILIVMWKILSCINILDISHSLSLQENWAIELLTEWTFLLRPFFENAKREKIPETILLRRQMENKSSSGDYIAVWDNEVTWRNYPYISNLFLLILQRIPSLSISKFDQATKLVPFVITIAEDYDPNNRLSGVSAINEMIRIISPNIIIQMKLDELFFQILIKNMSFDLLDLKRGSLTSLINNLFDLDGVPFYKRIEWLEETLSLLIKEASFARSLDLLMIILEALPEIINRLSIASICHLPAICGVVLEGVEKFDSNVNPLLEAILVSIFTNCWPRLQGHSTMISNILEKITLSTESELLEKFSLIEQKPSE